MSSPDIDREWGQGPDQVLPWTTTASVLVSIGKVEIVQYAEGTAHQIELVPRDCVLEMLIPPRLARFDRSGLFSKVGTTQPMGDVVFYPADHRIVIHCSTIGPVRAIRCHYQIAEIDRRFSNEELVAGLSIESPALTAAVHLLVRELASPGFQSSLLTESLATQVGIELGRYLRRKPDAVSARHLTQTQMALIDERIDSRPGAILAAELAELCQLSRRHFFRLFRQTTGMPPAEYITARQIERAKRMLQANGAVTKRVAHDCGFRTASAFSAAFRRETGMTPREFQTLSVR